MVAQICPLRRDRLGLTRQRLAVLARGARSPIVLCAALGLVVAQLWLARSPSDDLGPAAGAAVRGLLAAWGLFTLLDIGAALLRGRAPTAADSTSLVHTPASGFPLLGAWYLVAAGALFIAAALQRWPSRLAINLLGYALLAVPLVWLVQHRAGPGAARKAALVLAVFCFLPTNGDVRQPPVVERSAAGSPFRWSVGWPVDGWLLRHEIRLDRAAGGPRDLWIPLAARYDGPARVHVSVNGRPLGEARPEGDSVRITLPADVLADETRLAIELRQEPRDPALRLLATRWAGGASLGHDASSFFDGERWRQGTLDDVAGRLQPGTYVLRLERPR